MVAFDDAATMLDEAFNATNSSRKENFLCLKFTEILPVSVIRILMG